MGRWEGVWVGGRLCGLMGGCGGKWESGKDKIICSGGNRH